MELEPWHQSWLYIGRLDEVQFCEKHSDDDVFVLNCTGKLCITMGSCKMKSAAWGWH
jgi:hypothetical protein